MHAYLRRPNLVTISIPYLPGRNLRQQIHSSTVSYTTFRLSNAVLNCLWHHAYINNSIPLTSPAFKPRLANPFLTCFRKPNSVNKCVPNRVSTTKLRLTNPFLNCSPHLDLPASAGQIWSTEAFPTCFSTTKTIHSSIVPCNQAQVSRSITVFYTAPTLTNQFLKSPPLPSN